MRTSPARPASLSVLSRILVVALVATQCVPVTDVSAGASFASTRLTPKVEAKDASPRADFGQVDAGIETRAATNPLVEGGLPLAFERNVGQTDPEVAFQARGRGYGIYVTPTETVLSLAVPASKRADDGAPETEQRAIRLSFAGASPASEVVGEERLPGKANYFRGDDPSKWVKDIPTFASVRSRDVYRGVDVVHYGNQGQLEYDLIVAPGADPSAIRLEIEGADAIDTDGEGNLLLKVGSQTLRQKQPTLYQERDGVRTPVAGSYMLRQDGTVGFRIGGYDRSLALVIDPVLVYSTYLGGSVLSTAGTQTQDEIFDVAADSAGNIYVTGFSNATDYPTTPNSVSFSSQGGFDVVVSKFDPTATSLIYSTYLGGDANDRGFGVTVDAAGHAYVFGDTEASTLAAFPTTTGAFQRTNAGMVDVFVAKLSVDGASLVYSTLVGGSAVDRSVASTSGQYGSPPPNAGVASGGGGIEVDATGAVYFTGETGSVTYPTTPGAYDQSHNGGGDAFVTKLSPDGSSLVFSTLIGGNNRDIGVNLDILEVDPGVYDVFVAGATISPDFPTTLMQFRGEEDGFAIRLDAQGAFLLYSQIIGGPSNPPNADYCVGVAVIQDGPEKGYAYFAGHEGSASFPFGTPGAYQTSRFGVNGTYEAFVAKLDPNGNIAACTLFGREHSEQVVSNIALSPTGDVYVPIRTTCNFDSHSSTPMTPGAYDTTFADADGNGGDTPNHDIVLVKFNSDLSGVQVGSNPYLTPSYCTYIGGVGNDEARNIAVLPDGDVLLVGITESGSFPIRNPLSEPEPGQPQHLDGGTYRGGRDGFLLRLSPDGAGDADLVSSTFLNGSQNTNLVEAGTTVAVGQDDSIYVAGFTRSIDYPTTNPYDATLGGNNDAFVTKLAPGGTAVVYSTYIGGSLDDKANAGEVGGRGLAVDADGEAYLVGFTFSSDFPRTTGPVHAGSRDGFALKLNSSGNSLIFSRYLSGTASEDFATSVALQKNPMGDPRIYIVGWTLFNQQAVITRLDPTGTTVELSTFWGGTGYDAGYDIDVDTAGNIYVCTMVQPDAANVSPTPNGFDTTYNGNNDAYVLKLDSAGNHLASTWLGGQGDDRPYLGLRVDASDNVYVGGFTRNTGAAFSNYPTPAGVNAYDRTHNGGYDLFVSKLNSNLTQLLYSTVLGSNQDELAYGVMDVDTMGNVYLTSRTIGTNFPTTSDAPDQSFNGGNDAVVCKINTNVTGAASLAFSSYWGGSGSDVGYGAAVDSSGRIYVTGSTTSVNFPTSGGSNPSPYDSQIGGTEDVFLAWFRVCPNITSVTTSPVNGAIYSGQTATLTANAGGVPGLTYQWYEGSSGGANTLIPGATFSSYTTPALTASTTYFVQVTGNCNVTPTTVTSADIPVTVCTQPAITGPVVATPPEAFTTGVPSNTTVTLTVPATGSGLSYQWYLGQGGDTSVEVGSDSPMYSFSHASSGSYSYWVRVSGNCALPLTPADSPTVLVKIGSAVPLVVTNTLDDGSPGSLRWAINLANDTNQEFDKIYFDIPGSGPHSIALTSPLPAITAPVTIDGTTEPDYVDAPIIELNGAGAGAGADGLHVTGGSTIIRGLVINRFSGDGIELEGSGGNVVQNCYIGTDVTGTVDLGNGENGIFVNGSSNNTLGGTRVLREGNLISGNGNAGIELFGLAATDNDVQGSYIGVDAAGTVGIPNTDGIEIVGAPSNKIGASDDAPRKNLISQNTNTGVQSTSTSKLRAGASGNEIHENSIFGNGEAGILGQPEEKPLVTASISSGATLLIEGAFNAQAGQHYLIEYYRNRAANPCPGNGGQGEEFIGSDAFDASASGLVQFTHTFSPTSVVPGETVAVTVTSSDLGTSDFSYCQVVGDNCGSDPIAGQPDVASQQATVVLNTLSKHSQDARVKDVPEPGVLPSMIPPSDARIVAEPEGFASDGDDDGNSASKLATAAPSRSFPGVSDPDMPMVDDTVIPPDPQGAAGPNHLVEVTNSHMRVLTKDGTVLESFLADDFWAPLGQGDVSFNPRLVYDPIDGRFILVAGANARAANSALLVAVSQTSDPLGTWNLYRFEGDVTDQSWVDYPTLGFGQDRIAVQVNMLARSGVPNQLANAFLHSRVYVFPKANLYAGGNGAHTLIASNCIGGTQVPTFTYDAPADDDGDPMTPTPIIYLVQNFNGDFLGNGLLRIYSISGDIGSETLNPGPLVSTRERWTSKVPGDADLAPQLGSAQKIQVNDARIQSAVFRNGYLWCAHTILTIKAPWRATVQWWQIDPATGAVFQRGRVPGYTTSTMYAFPAIAVNTAGEVMLGYSRFDSTGHASAAYRCRAPGDPLNSLQNEVILKAGEAPYYKTADSDKNRWGDYASVVVDPDGLTFWMYHEYAETPVGGVDLWGTWWGAVGQAPASPSGLSATAVSQTQIDLAWTDQSANETGFLVERKTGAGGTYAQIASLGAGVTAYSDMGLTLGTEYFFRVRATNAAGESAYSGEASATTSGGACSISCPSDVTVPADAGQCTAVVNYTPPAPTDCGGGASVSCSPAPGFAFPIGTTTVTCSVTGGSGPASCTFDVTVTDVEGPTITCPSNVTMPAAAGQCSAVVNYSAPTATDCSGIASVTCTPASGSTFPVGTATTVTCTATDNASNTAQCTFTVTVTDVTGPSMTCPSNITMPAPAGQCSATVTYSTPTATDDCSGVASVVCSPASGTSFTIGTQPVTCTATDGVGNASQCSFNVTVTDVEVPVITCPSNVTVVATSGAGAVVNYAAPTATDTCSTPTVVCSPLSGTTFAIGTHTVTCTAMDGSGNTAPCAFTVAVDLVPNGDFELGTTSWTGTAPVSNLINNNPAQPARSGSWKAQLLGSGTSNSKFVQTQPLYNLSPGTPRTLRFYLKIVTSEPSNDPTPDTLTVRIMKPDNTVFENIRVITTADAATYANYTLVTIQLSGSHTQLNYKIRFGGTEDAGNATTFLIDDVSVQ